MRQYKDRRYTFVRIYKYGITRLHFVVHKIQLSYVTVAAKEFVSFNVQYSLFVGAIFVKICAESSCLTQFGNVFLSPCTEHDCDIRYGILII
jgi:hypothetical protein